jgi:predicted nucleotidyltransferase
MARSDKAEKNPIEVLLQDKREEIPRIAEKHGACNVRVFGSVVHGEATDNSDIDLLVDTSEKTSPWFPAGLIEELEQVLGSVWTWSQAMVCIGCCVAGY